MRRRSILGIELGVLLLLQDLSAGISLFDLFLFENKKCGLLDLRRWKCAVDGGISTRRRMQLRDWLSLRGNRFSNPGFGGRPLPMPRERLSWQGCAPSVPDDGVLHQCGRGNRY